MADGFIEISVLNEFTESELTIEDRSKVIRDRFCPGLRSKARSLLHQVREFNEAELIETNTLAERVLDQTIARIDWSVSFDASEFAKRLILAIEKEIDSLGDSTRSCASDDFAGTETFVLRDTPAIDRQQEYRLHACIADLPDEVRAAVAMRQIEGTGYATIANRLNVQANEAAGMCRRGIELLISCLKTKNLDDETRLLQANLDDTHSRQSSEDDSDSELEATR
jgi:hypothetical protein